MTHSPKAEASCLSQCCEMINILLAHPALAPLQRTIMESRAAAQNAPSQENCFPACMKYSTEDEHCQEYLRPDV